MTGGGQAEKTGDVDLDFGLPDGNIMAGQFLVPFPPIPMSMNCAWPTLLASDLSSDPNLGFLPSHNLSHSAAAPNCSPSGESVLFLSQHLSPPIETDSTVRAESTPDSPSFTATSSAKTPQPTEPVHYVRQLADLNVQLYEHAETLPALSTATRDREPTLDGRVFAIDKTFGMTQTLIDMISRLYPRAGAYSDFAPDQGTILLLQSCANRVFDIYEVIFGHMRGCIQHKLTPVTTDGKTLLLPQLRIGSFAPPSPAAITMHMLMVVMMASSLFDQLQEVLGVWRGDTSGHRWGCRERTEVQLAVGTASRFPDFTAEAKSEVSRRASAVAGEILSTRQLLLGMSGSQTVGSMTNVMSA